MISVIIPTLNEEKFIGDLLSQLIEVPNIEIIVVDGGSDDETQAIVSRYHSVQWMTAPQGRARQMNAGAQSAASNILYFIHADTRPTKTFPSEILQAIKDNADAGCFSYAFYPSSILLRMNSYLTKFSHGAAGGGDQTLFIRREVFRALGGFDESMHLMEDFELVKRIKQHYEFRIIANDVLVSSRKYRHNSWLWVQIVNGFIFAAFSSGIPSQKLANWYRRLLRN